MPDNRNVRSETIQRSVAPTMGLCTETPLYFRANDHVTYRYRTKAWRLRPGGVLRFDTYFNGLSIRRWKKTAGLVDLTVSIAFEGRMTARLNVLQAGAVATVVDEIELASAERTERRWSIGGWHDLVDGVLFLSFHAEADSTLHRYAFATSTPPARPVRLGLCITHYARRAQVVPAIARLRRELLDDPAYTDRVALVVVDNSCDLDADETGGATLIPNRNLGGAGGFARGMMHLQDEGRFTHAMFMDDDASCEVESIRRTIALLAFGRDPRTAVAGGMLLEREPFRQHEAGARFDGVCMPLRHRIDLRDPAVLAWNEWEQHSDYGAWYFFAFPLARANGYPYPFFVRGDDIDFSLRNQFAIVTSNGIASWQEDFAFKHLPQTNYLDARNHLLQILHGFRGDRALALKVALRMFLLPNLAGQYDLASAAVMAIDDVRRGPDFFRDHADLVQPRRRLQAMVRAERMTPLDAGLLRSAELGPIHESPWHRAYRLATLNGHLLPTLLFRRNPVRFEKTYVLPLRGTFRRRRIHVHHEISGTGMTLDHSKRRFFGNAWRFARSITAFAFAYPRLAAEFRAAYPYLTSENYWRRQFKADGGATTPPLTKATDRPTEPIAHAA